MTNILVLAEHQEGKVKKTTLELVSKAQELASSIGASVIPLILGEGDLSKVASDFGPFGVAKVATASHPNLARYNPIAYGKVLHQAIQKLSPSIVLGTASPFGKDLFPRVAALIPAGVATDCTDLRIDGGKLVAHRPIFSGKVFADVSFATPIQMATARPNSFPIREAGAAKNPEVVSLPVDPGEIRSPIREIVKGATDRVDLTEAEIIVSGGRAMVNAENFKILQELADVLGATVGASRAAVDSGFAPHEMQVGQTGKVVNPKLYIAFGISGAIQHLAGMRTSKVIVAVNKDPEAPIFSKADYGIVGDLFTLVPLLSTEFKKLLSDH